MLETRQSVTSRGAAEHRRQGETVPTMEGERERDWERKRKRDLSCWGGER